MQTRGRIGVLILWMHTLSLVNSQDCKLGTFLSSGLYDSNFDISNLESSYSTGKEVRVYCNVGHRGFFKLVCTNGRWGSKGKPCEPIPCGHPGEAQFADFNLAEGEDFVFGSRVVYTCHKGYQMVSRINYRRCFSEGWDGLVPVCEAQQCPVILVNKNVLVNGDPEEATFGNVVRFSCKSKSEILDGPNEIYCNEEGEWSGRAPKCIELKCPLPEIENGYVVDPANEYSENDILHFSCNRKFKRSQEMPSKCTKVGMRAEWSPMPQCEPVRCSVTLPPLKGTAYEPSYKTVFVPGETLRVTCGKEFWISSPQEISAETRCNDEGQWTIPPVCKEVVCINQRDVNVKRWYPPSWSYRLLLGATVQYMCVANFRSPDGSNLAKCTRDGWKPNPLCQEITCNRLDIENAVNRDYNTLVYKNNNRVYYECMEGFTGNPTRVCGEYGWKGDSTCTEITCNMRDIPNAHIQGTVKSLYRYQEQVEYVCNSGFEGRFTLTCGKGQWIGTPNCGARMCEKPEIINADIREGVKQQYNNNDKLTYVCKYSEEVVEAKCARGAWTGIRNCPDCPKAVVPNGFAVRPKDDKLFYRCNEGYKLFKKGWWGAATCIDHVWSGLEQCIGQTECGEFPVIPNGKVFRFAYQNAKNAKVLCNDGFDAQINSFSCDEGEWSSRGLPLREVCTPKPNNCDAPPKFDNAVIRTPYKNKYVSNSEVVYECRHKYMLVGEGRLQCHQGRWEAKNITCARYCDNPNNDTITVEAQKGRFRDGEELHYHCKQRAEHLKATCVDGRWNPRVACDAVSTRRDATDAPDGNTPS